MRLPSRDGYVTLNCNARTGENFPLASLPARRNEQTHGHAIMSKRILITGGAGFIGSHLSERLLREGHEVICMDNFFTGSKQNILHLTDYPGFEVIRHDVTVPYVMEVDQIYNLACPASPPHYQFDPIHTMKTSVLGALNMLGLAKRCKARILQASTSEVYGDPMVHPQPETYWGNVNPVGVRSCYDEGKRCAETLFMDYRRMNGVDVRIIRIFNTYGPRMNPNDGRVVSNFIVQALKGEDITIYGTGKQTRSFQYVDDLVEGMVRMMDTEGFSGPVNLGNPEEFTMLELAEKVIEMTGSSSKTVFRPLPLDDPTQRKPDIRLAKEKLGWKPHITLEKGWKRPSPISGAFSRNKVSQSQRLLTKFLLHADSPEITGPFIYRGYGMPNSRILPVFDWLRKNGSASIRCYGTCQQQGNLFRSGNRPHLRKRCEWPDETGNGSALVSRNSGSPCLLPGFRL